MLNVDIAKLEKCVDDLRALLKEGLLTADIWDRETGLSLAGYNAQPAAALFNQVTGDIANTLEGSGFPKLGRFYLLDLQDDHSVLILQPRPELLYGMLLSSKKVNMGVLFSLAIPRALDAVAKAVL